MNVFVRMAKYGGIDVALFPVNLLCAFLLVLAGAHHRVATVGGFALQFSLAFFLNRAYTFKKPETATAGGLLRTYLVGAISVTVALLCTEAGVEGFGLAYFWARILASAPTWAVAYVLDAWFTFSTKPFSSS